MKKILMSLVLISSVAYADGAVYQIYKSKNQSCYRNDLYCRESVRNAVIKEVHTAAAEYCHNEFGNQAKVIEWDAYCSAFFQGIEQAPPIPQPPQMPDYPVNVNCSGKVTYTCE